MRDRRHEHAHAWADIQDWLVELDLEGKSPLTVYQYERHVAPLLLSHPEKRLEEFTGQDVKDELHRRPVRSRHVIRAVYNARRLQRRRVDLYQHRLAIVSGKGDKDALIPFWPEVAQAVARLDLFERLGPEDHLWYLCRYPVGDHRRRRDPIGDTTFENWYKRGIATAGVRYLKPHRTRHTYGWWLKTEKRIPIEERAFLMRHESINTTKTYYDRTGIQDVEARIRQGVTV